MADLFKLQDRVVARLGNTLGIELVKAEAEKSTRSNSPDAIDLTMRAWGLVWQGIQEQSMPEKQAIYYAARTMFEQSLSIDPRYADALAGDAMTYMVQYLYGWSAAGTDFEAKIVDKLTGRSRRCRTTCAATIRRASTSSPFLAGDLSLADLYLAPIVFYVSLTPDKDAVFDVDGFQDWWTRMQNLQSFKDTPPNPG